MVAQTPPPALAVSVSPKQAGTEAKPRSVKLTLTVAPLAGVPSMTVFFPKQLHISNYTLPQCTASDAAILAGGCAAMEAGTGSITTAAGTVALTSLVGADDLIFKTKDAVLHGKLSQASGAYTAKMTLPLPAGTTGVTLSLKKVKRGASLFATRGCPLKFKVLLAGKQPLTASAKCGSS